MTNFDFNELLRLVSFKNVETIVTSYRKITLRKPSVQQFVACRTLIHFYLEHFSFVAPSEIANKIAATVITTSNILRTALKTRILTIRGIKICSTKSKSTNCGPSLVRTIQRDVVRKQGRKEKDRKVWREYIPPGPASGLIDKATLHDCILDAEIVQVRSEDLHLGKDSKTNIRRLSRMKIFVVISVERYTVLMVLRIIQLL